MRNRTQEILRSGNRRRAIFFLSLLSLFSFLLTSPPFCGDCKDNNLFHLPLPLVIASLSLSPSPLTSKGFRTIHKQPPSHVPLSLSLFYSSTLGRVHFLFLSLFRAPMPSRPKKRKGALKKRERNSGFGGDASSFPCSSALGATPKRRERGRKPGRGGGRNHGQHLSSSLSITFVFRCVKIIIHPQEEDLPQGMLDNLGN